MEINELILHILNHHCDDYEEIIKLYYQEIYAYVFKQVGETELCKELCQDIFFEAYRHLKSFDSRKSSFRTWLYKIANYTCIDYFRSKSYKQRLVTSVVEDENSLIARGKDPVMDLIKQEQSQAVSETMSRLLKPKHERIMRYHFFSDLSVEEISNIENISTKTIYSIIDRSIKKLRMTLGGQ